MRRTTGREVTMEEAAIFVSSVTDQLLILYPDGCSEENNEEVAQKLEALLGEQNLSKKEEIGMKKAMPIALLQWKKQAPVLTSTSPKENTVSLFDQLIVGGFQAPVNIDDLKEAVSSEARMALFERVSYLDDLLLDWNEIKHILSNDLQESLQSSAALQIIRIHRKYYDMGRASQEYLELQYGICHNIFDAILAYAQQNDANADSLFLLMRTWSDILVDLVQRDLFMEDLVGDMESGMLELLLNDSKHHYAMPAKANLISTAQILALVDSHAKWFRGWARCASMRKFLTSLEKSSILPVIISRCCLDGNRTESSGDFLEIQSAIRSQSLFILASIIEKTRVSCFPFHLAPTFFADIENSTKVGNTEIETNIDRLIDIFLQSMALEDSVFSEQVCCCALQDILPGCSGIISESSKRIREVNERVSTMSVTAQNAWETTKYRLLQ